MQEENNIDLQQEAKDLVLNELEKNGVINYMRAKIKKSILDIISNEKEGTKQKLDFDFMTPLHRLNKSKELVLACQLIKEFLKFYELEYTLPIFENESNIKENVKRETLIKELKLQGKKEDSTKPVLLMLIMDKLNRVDNLAIGLTSSKGPTDRYDLNNNFAVFNRDDNSNPIIPNKKQLSPITFGSTNKSLDMNNNSGIDSDKFNTFNISDVYKRDKQENSKEENKGKEITSADILGQGEKEKSKISEEIKKEMADGKPAINQDLGLNKNEGDFKEVILEDIDNNVKISQEKKDMESQSYSASNLNSQGVDSSADPTSLNKLDYVEEVEKKI